MTPAKRKRKSRSKPAGAIDRVGRVDLPAPSITQLRMFVMVVDEGSFAAAARKIGRATSVVSYSIAKLEAQLGASLFTRDTTRKPQLTEAGRTVLCKARTIITDVVGLSAEARGVGRMFEPELFIALDGVLPSDRIVDAIKAFRVAFPTVPMHVRLEAPSAVEQLVLARKVTIGISGSLPGETLPDDIEAIGVGLADLVPVSAPSELQPDKDNSAGEAEHPQLVLTDRLSDAVNHRGGLEQPWRLTDLTSMKLLLTQGIGWGYLPESLINEAIERGELVALTGRHRRSSVLHAIHRKDTPLGPAASFFVSRLVSQISSEGAQRPKSIRATLRGAASQNSKAQ